MNVKVTKPVIEGKDYGDMIFWNENSFCEKTGAEQVSFFPRPYVGGDALVGFSMIWYPHKCSSWKEFEQNVLLSDEVIEAYWKEYRNGFHVEKYYYKMVKFFGYLWEDSPETSTWDFGRLPLPSHVEERLLAAGVKLEAWS